jgi:chlorite dismutase
MDEKDKFKFSSFLFIASDDKYKHLIRNERIAANEELANLIASLQEKIFLRTYLLKGLRSDCDMLFWLMAEDLEFIQESWAQISTTGAGKYLNAHKCFIGLCKTGEEEKTACSPEYGKYKYMLVHPLVRQSPWYELSSEKQQELYDERKEILNRYHNICEHFFYSYGLGDQEMIVVRECDNLEILAEVSKNLRQQKIKAYTKKDTPCFLCIGRDLLEILSKLG